MRRRTMGAAKLWSALARKQTAKNQLLRFLLSGGFNTVSGYLIYLALLWLTGAAYFSYSVSWVAGIAISYGLNLKFTFRARHSWRKMLVFPAVYVAAYLIGLLVLHIALRLDAPKEIAPLFAIPLTVPFTFFLMRLLLKPDREQ